MRKYLVKKQGIKWVGRRENGAAKNGVVVVIVDQAFIHLHFYPRKPFSNLTTQMR